MKNSHLCQKAASAIESSTRALIAAARELEGATDEAGQRAAEALKAAQLELLNARKALQNAGGR